MPEKKYILKTTPFVLLSALFVSGLVGYLFFNPSNVKNVWPIGAGLILLMFYHTTIAYFYEDEIVVVNLFFRTKKVIRYEDVVRVDFNGRGQGFGLFYKNQRGKEKKLRFDLYDKFYVDLKALLVSKNAKVKFTIYDEPIRDDRPIARSHPKHRR